MKIPNGEGQRSTVELHMLWACLGWQVVFHGFDLYLVFSVGSHCPKVTKSTYPFEQGRGAVQSAVVFMLRPCGPQCSLLFPRYV